MTYFLKKKQAESFQPEFLNVSSAVDQLGQVTESDGIKCQINLAAQSHRI